MRFSLLPLAAVTAATVASTQPSAEPVPMREWTVPWEKSRPRDPIVDAKGRVWFVGQEGNYVAYLEPGSGRFRRFEIDPGTHPHNVVVDSKGFAWYAGIGKRVIAPVSGSTRPIIPFR